MRDGARIRTDFRRPDPAVLSAFVGLASCDVADAVGKLSVVNPGIRFLGGPGGPAWVGPALTVRCRPDDNLMIHAAVDRAQPGDVIVVSAGGESHTALVGELVSAWARERGVAGFVIDGAVRDVAALALPVFARGTTPRAPGKADSGEVGYPVALGGVPVSAGDITVADADGVVVVPEARAQEVLDRVREIQARDAAARAAMAAGTYDRSWVGPALRAAGVDEEGGSGDGSAN